MRFAAYAGTSAVLAAGVILRAVHERPNFYSAAVYLSQSNACLMILANLVLLLAFCLLFGLQRILYGPLRPIELEQLYEKAWFAVTETCLAMTIFREEVGAWFLVMFTSLLAGKVWGWIGEGRVEILEQQPPANPRLFHARLTLSLGLSLLFDVSVLLYCVRTVLEEARPGMMVMFAFEFAVLLTSSLSTFCRYAISLYEMNIVRQQIQARLDARRAQVQAAREAARQQSSSGGEVPAEVLIEEDIGDIDIDVPGWEDKGRFIFYLDLLTDLYKLVIYMIFFTILLTFNGLPIHILRDVFMTARSFIKRVNDFLRYRNATRNMNARYPDARAEDLVRENTCIICREEMRPWEQPEAQAPGNNAPGQATQADERLRPKKLPCGHVLHVACLRSWLERQQVCPTCRRSVIVPASSNLAQQTRPNGPGTNVAGTNQAPGQGNAPNPNGQGANQDGVRIFNLGPFRVAFGAWALGPRQNIADQLRAAQAHLAQGNNPPQQPQSGDQVQLQGQRTVHTYNSALMQLQLLNMERQIAQEIHNLQNTHDQLSVVRSLQTELTRLRSAQNRPSHVQAAQGLPPIPTSSLHSGGDGGHAYSGHFPNYQLPQTFTASPEQQSVGPGNQQLPAGMTIPQGWTVLPLQRVGPGAPASVNVQSTINTITGSTMGTSGSTSTSEDTNTRHTPTTTSGGIETPPATVESTSAIAETNRTLAPASSSLATHESSRHETSARTTNGSSLDTTGNLAGTASSPTGDFTSSNSCEPHVSHGVSHTQALTPSSSPSDRPSWDFGAPPPSERKFSTGSSAPGTNGVYSPTGVQAGGSSEVSEQPTQSVAEGKRRAPTVEDYDEPSDRTGS